MSQIDVMLTPPQGREFPLWTPAIIISVEATSSAQNIDVFLPPAKKLQDSICLVLQVTTRHTQKFPTVLYDADRENLINYA